MRGIFLIILVLFLLSSLVSCVEKEKVVLREEIDSLKNRILQMDTTLSNKSFVIDSSYHIDYGNKGWRIYKVITIDKCKFITNSYKVDLIHHPACNNPNHYK